MRRWGPGRGLYGMEGWHARVEKQPDGCWLWVGKIGRGGYGWYTGVEPDWPVKNAPAHRYGYEHLVGPVPAGMELDHLCHSRDLTCMGGRCIHRQCVNPDHLEPVTHSENITRGRTAAVRLAQLQALTHCPEGHELTPENRISYSRCRICITATHRRRYQRIVNVTNPCGVVSARGNPCQRQTGHSGRHHGELPRYKP